MTVTFTVRGEDAYMSGDIDVRVRDAIADLPGKRRWRIDGTFVCEASRSNIEHIKTHLPDAVWVGAEARMTALDAVLRAERETAAAAASVPVRFDWKSPPYHDKQRQAFAWARNREFFGLLLEMGLGKTWCAINIGASKWSSGEIDAMVVVAPNGVHDQWASEQIPQHLPDWVGRDVYVHRAGKTPPDWVGRPRGSNLAILCINCEALAHESGRALLAKFMAGRRVFLVVDESVRFKSHRAARTKALLQFSREAVARCILSGAPITKGVEDLYSQLMLLSPDILGHSSFTTFLSRYCVTEPAYRGAPRGAVKISGYRNMQELIERVDAHCFRATKAECLDLPPKIYMTREVPMTPEQARIYRDLKEALLTEINGGRISMPNAAVRLMRLQQVLCGHLPVVNEEGEIVRVEDVPSNRVQAVIDLLEEDDAPMIVWARFRYDAKVLGAAMEAAGIPFVEYTGATPQRDRQEVVRKFMAGEVRVFLGNPAAAGTGLNLQRASRMVYYSNSFNADYRWQSEDRAHRIGQTNPVTIVDLVTPRTLDARIIRALKNREDIARMVLDDARQLLVDE